MEVQTVNPFKQILLPYQWTIFEDQNPFIISKISRQCGKSLTFAAKAVHKSIMNADNLVLLVSVNQRSADELLRKVKQWAEACKIASNGLVTYYDNATTITFNNKSRIISVPASPSSLRGWSGDVILDEYALVDGDDEIFQAVLPVITSKMKGTQHSLWICSTPSSLDTQFAKIWNSDEDKWHRYEYNIYQCVEQGLKADPATLKSIVNDDLIWNTEYMVQFASGAGTAFPPEALNDIEYTTLPNTKMRWIGFDVARKSDYSVITICAYDKGNKNFYVEDLVKMKDKPYNEQLQMVKTINQRYQIVGGYVDAVGVGSMLAEEIQRTINSKIKPFYWTGNNKTEAYDNLRTCIQNRNFFVNPQHKQSIINDFGNVRRYISNTGKISYSAPHNSDGHSDITSALVLALQSIKDNPASLSYPSSYTRFSRLS